MKLQNYEDEFIKIVHLQSKPRTEVYDVISKCGDESIGDVSWDRGWRHYVFGDRFIKLSDRCLFALGFFVMKMNIAHKGKKQFVEEFIEIMDREFGKNWNKPKEKKKPKHPLLGDTSHLKVTVR